jgi:diphthine-ammonia ligase
MKRCALLFSGGKDSTLAGYYAIQNSYKISCLITLKSANEDSFMFHTPLIGFSKMQAGAMFKPLIIQETKGKKESELKDLKKAIKRAIEDYEIEAVITGAVESVYQASRVQKICDSLKIECFNPLWQMSQLTILEELIKNNFKVVIAGVFAYPLDASWVGREINRDFITDIKKLNEKYKINPAGEGGEYETFVTNCPMFKHPINLPELDIVGKGNSWRAVVKQRGEDW